jgi:molybdopterin/thiamine biosynthesis adenylyltransferase
MRIVIAGIGALGSTATLLLRNAKAELALVDFDRVESKNLLAQSFTKPSIGKNKADAMKLQLANFWGVKAEAFGVRLTADNIEQLLANADLIIDAFDNQKSRELLSAYARRANKALVHAAISAEGSFGIVRWDERFAPDAEDKEGQATCEGGEHLPFIGLVAAVLARAVQDFLKDGTKRDAMISLAAVTPTNA